MFKIAICDDDREYAEQLWLRIRDFYHWSEPDVECFFYYDGMDIIEKSKAGMLPIIDVLYLDVELPSIDGIHVKKILIPDPNIRRIVFVTNHSEVINLAFGIKVVDFCLKGIEDDRAVKLAGSIRNELYHKTVIRMGHVCFQLERLLYIESDKEYSIVHSLDNGMHEIKQREKISLKKWQSVLPSKYVVRISKTCLINLLMVSHFGFEDAIIVSSESFSKQFTIGRNYKSSVNDSYLQYQIDLSMKRL